MSACITTVVHAKDFNNKTLETVSQLLEYKNFKKVIIYTDENSPNPSEESMQDNILEVILLKVLSDEKYEITLICNGGIIIEYLWLRDMFMGKNKNSEHFPSCSHPLSGVQTKLTLVLFLSILAIFRRIFHCVHQRISSV